MGKTRKEQAQARMKQRRKIDAGREAVFLAVASIMGIDPLWKPHAQLEQERARNLLRRAQERYRVAAKDLVTREQWCAIVNEAIGSAHPMKKTSARWAYAKAMNIPVESLLERA